LVQHLKETGSEYDAIIGEIAAAPEPDLDSEHVWLTATIRQLKLDALKAELNTLFSAGLSSDEIGVRYREITSKQDQLMREADAAMSPR
jgi:DNA primase